MGKHTSILDRISLQMFQRGYLELKDSEKQEVEDFLEQQRQLAHDEAMDALERWEE